MSFNGSFLKSNTSESSEIIVGQRVPQIYFQNCQIPYLCTNLNNSQSQLVATQQYEPCFSFNIPQNQIQPIETKPQKPPGQQVASNKDCKSIRVKDYFKRTRFSSYQLCELEIEFKLNAYVVASRKSKISKRLNIPEKHVQIWFQNRRMKEKRKAQTSLKMKTESKISIRKLLPKNELLGNVTSMTQEQYKTDTRNNASSTSERFGSPNLIDSLESIYEEALSSPNTLSAAEYCNTTFSYYENDTQPPSQEEYLEFASILKTYFDESFITS